MDIVHKAHPAFHVLCVMAQASYHPMPHWVTMSGQAQSGLQILRIWRLPLVSKPNIDPSTRVPGAYVFRSMTFPYGSIDLYTIPGQTIALFPMQLVLPYKATSMGVAVNSRQSPPSNNSRIGLYQAGADTADGTVDLVLGGDGRIERSDIFQQITWAFAFDEQEVPAGIYFIAVYNADEGSIQVCTYGDWVGNYQILHEAEYGGILFPEAVVPAGNLPSTLNLSAAVDTIHKGGLVAALHA